MAEPGAAGGGGTADLPLRHAEAREFSAILARRRQIVGMITAEKNRLGAAASKPVEKRIRAHVK